MDSELVGLHLFEVLELWRSFESYGMAQGLHRLLRTPLPRLLETHP